MFPSHFGFFQYFFWSFFVLTWLRYLEVFPARAVVGALQLTRPFLRKRGPVWILSTTDEYPIFVFYVLLTRLWICTFIICTTNEYSSFVFVFSYFVFMFFYSSFYVYFRFKGEWDPGLCISRTINEYFSTCF